MSRIGRLPVQIPAGVSITRAGRTLSAKGPRGALSRELPELIDVSIEGDKVHVRRSDESMAARQRHGLSRTLVQNMVQGVSQGFERRLEIIGVGYKAEVQGQNLNLSLGFSHQVNFPIPAGMTVQVEKGTALRLLGPDKEVVGQTAAVLRGYRPPDAYKGKGVRYLGEVVRLKAGKSGTK